MTADVPFSCLEKLATDTALRNRHTSALQGRDRQKLQLVASGKAARHDSAAYGALMPHNAVDKRATDSMLHWLAHAVFKYCMPRDINTAIQTPCLFVHSQVIAAAMKKYEADGMPTADFDPGNGDWLRPFNFATLRRQLDAEQCETLANVKGLRFVAFILYSHHHWSLLIYDLKDLDLCHIDSLPEGKVVRGLHEDTRFHCMFMLKAMGLLPADTELTSLKNKVVQNGAWQCGYSVAAFLAHYSGKLKTLMAPALTAPRIVVDDELLRQFAVALETEAEINERCAAYARSRHGHVYTDK